MQQCVHFFLGGGLIFGTQKKKNPYITVFDFKKRSCIFRLHFLISDVNCTISLFYNMRGNGINTLLVYSTDVKEIFMKKGEQGDEWKNDSITTFIQGSQKVRL